MANETFLVTGAAGFVGSTLCARLLAEGHTILAVDSLTSYYDPKLKHRNMSLLREWPTFQHVCADVNDVAKTLDLSDVSKIIHLAAQPGVRASWGTEFTTYTRANILATQALLERSRSLPDLKAFVYASSSSVYGNALTHPTSETSATQPFSPYGVTKLAAEHLGSLYANNFGTPVRSLRFFTVYGPRQRPDMAFTRFFQHILDGDAIPVYGDGEQVREFTFVDDVVDAVCRAANMDLPNGVVMNVSGGSTVTLNNVIDLMRNDLGVKFDLNHLPETPGDVRRTGGTTDVIHALTGWTPQVPLIEGLSRQWDWAKGALVKNGC